MESIIDALPGLPLPVSEVTAHLGRMWQGEEPGPEDGAPSQFRASQMNLILHFGLETTPEDARARFDDAIRFSQRYPSRIIVLCPEKELPRGRRLMEGKLFAQCYIDFAPRTMCCCEALMLGYPVGEKGYLENQVSIWLENDLPTCHWFHRVPAGRIRSHYFGFLRGMRKIIFDGSAGAEGFRDIPWENPARVADLAHARMLPVRQTLGQYLSGFNPELLVEHTARVEVEAPPALAGEAFSLCQWLAHAYDLAGSGAVDFVGARSEDRPDIHVRWKDGSGKLVLEASLATGEGRGWIVSSLPGAPGHRPLNFHLLAPESALSEAIFFS